MTVALAGKTASRLSARAWGAGDGTVVVGHGFGTDQTVWTRLMPYLARGHRVISYNLACLDNERFEVSAYRDLSDYADDLAALLDEQDVRDAVYIGHSVGGMIGALASLAHPSAFARLVLLNASPRYLDAPGYQGGFSRAELDDLYAAMATDYHAWVVGLASGAMGDATRETIREFAGGLAAMRPDIALSVARTIFESDLRAILPSMEHDVAFVHTRDDIMVPPSVPEYISSVLPGAQMISLSVRGHLPHLSAPHLVAEALAPIIHPGGQDPSHA